MRKVFLTSAVALASTIVLAQVQPTDPAAAQQEAAQITLPTEGVVAPEAIPASDNGTFCGMYAGAGIGIDFVKWKVPEILKMTGGNKTGASFSLIGGAGKTFHNKVYGGGEIEISLRNSAKLDKKYNGKIEDYKDDTEVKAYAKREAFTIGLFGRLGYVVRNDTLLFAMLGCRFSKNKVGLSWTTPVDKESKSMSDKKNMFNIGLGLGVEKKVHKKLSVRGDLIYMFPNSGSSLSDADWGSSNATKSKIKFSEMNLRVSLIYNH